MCRRKLSRQKGVCLDVNQVIKNNIDNALAIIKFEYL